MDDDPVIWYTFGAHHTPCPEDWPVMPAASIEFKLKPSGFFGRNPALDVPRSPEKEGGNAGRLHVLSSSHRADK